jgi:type VI secretion system protein ImpM
MTSAPGWYGKIPALGDFASRRLKPEFIAGWDSWLQHSIAASRALLGERWLDCYLTSPIWRFALLPGAFDASAWAGLLMASVDKVGRHFPLTLALEIDPDACPDPLAAALGAQDWYAALERAALAALDLDFSAEDLERELAQLPFPAPPADNDRGIANLAQWWQAPRAEPLSLDLPSVAALADTIAASARRVLGSGAGRSLWWSVARESGATQLHCLTGLPPEEYLSVLLQGGDA